MIKSLHKNCLIVVCLCTIAFAGIRCSREEAQAKSESTTLNVLWSGDERFLGPAADDAPKLLMFLTLAKFRNQEGEVIGRLAERWDHSPDLHEWTFYLRQNVRWHDGVPVTAHDIEFTLELLSHSSVLKIPPDAIKSFDVIDDFTFRINFTAPYDAIDGWTVYYPKHLLEDLDPKDFYKWDFWTQPVGNGPYRYVRHVPNTMMELDANPDFYRGKPEIERLVFKFGGSSKLTELLSGNVDVASYVKQTDIAKLAQDGRFRIYYSFTYYEAMALQWNHRHFLFKDAAVRRAMTMAINRRELYEVLNFPPDVPIFDGLGSAGRARTQYEKGLLGEPVPFDLERAGALLDAAGWQDSNGDGIREKNGELAKFEVLVSSDRILSTVEQGIYIQEQLRRVGIQMDIRQVEQAVAVKAYRAGEFDAAFRDVKNDPVVLLKMDWFGDKSPIGYKNSELVKLLQEAEKAAFAEDLEEEDRIFQKIWQIFLEDAPVTFLFAWPEAYVAHKRLQGMGNKRNPIAIMEDLWIEEKD